MACCPDPAVPKLLPSAHVEGHFLTQLKVKTQNRISDDASFVFGVQSPVVGADTAHSYLPLPLSSTRPPCCPTARTANTRPGERNESSVLREDYVRRLQCSETEGADICRVLEKPETQAGLFNPILAFHRLYILHFSTLAARIILRRYEEYILVDAV